MIKIPQNDKGLTLVEILAAIVILSLVILAFMTFFTQSAKFTMHNQETLTAVQVAEDIVAKIRDKNSFEDLLGVTLNNIPADRLKGSELQNGIYFYAPSSKYNVTITLADASTPVKAYLRKAKISVMPTGESKIGNTPFETEIYFEVTTP